MPYYPELSLSLPPVLEILEWADRQQFDAVHVSTPGPMGFCGWLVSKMLRVPLLGTYHTDFPANVEQYTRDHRARQLTEFYLRLLYGGMETVFTRSRGYVHALQGLGLKDEHLETLRPGVDVTRFRPDFRDESIWRELAVNESKRLLYCGRVSEEKNLPLLTTIFKMICKSRKDVALIVAGDGPYAQKMRRELDGLPVYFQGFRSDAELARLYASADLLVFPSRTDTLGQVVMEAHACGLPAIVSQEGGPKEIVQDGETGIVLASAHPSAWASAIESLLDDDGRRNRMSAAAVERASTFSLAESFDSFWSAHVAATAEAVETDSGEVASEVSV
jgi:glycosyltransferase involved in cell wall biosynthesis